MAALPQTGITISMVGEALGTTSRDLGTLCKHSSINMWSKNKPLNIPTTSAITDEMRKQKHWGLEVISANTIDGLIQLADQNLGIGVTYDKPTGGSTSPYRLGDFRGYNHTANAPVQAYFKDGQKYDVAGYTGTEWMFVSPLQDIQKEGNISVQELYNVTTRNDGVADEMEYGIALVYGTYIRWAIGGIPWGNASWTVLKGKKCKVYEFYANIPVNTIGTTWLAQQTDRFCLLPNTGKEVTFTNTGSTAPSYTDVAVRAQLTLDTMLNQITGTVTLSSYDTSTTTYTGGTYSSVLVNFYDDADRTNAIGAWSTTNVTVGAETSVTLNVSESIRTLSTQNVYYSVATKSSTSSSYVTRLNGMCVLGIGGDIPRV